MAESDPKAVLQRYLQIARDALLWKLDGLSEYDVRRPLVPTGTNLLGLVKHVASVEAGLPRRHLRSAVPASRCRGSRPTPRSTPTCSRPPTRPASRSSTSTTACGPTPTPRSTRSTLDAEGTVPWWPAERNPVTLHTIVVHMIAETNRHAGHADLVRELIDGASGLRADNSNLPDGDASVVARLPPAPRGHRRRGRSDCSDCRDRTLAEPSPPTVRRCGSWPRTATGSAAQLPPGDRCHRRRRAPPHGRRDLVRRRRPR